MLITWPRRAGRICARAARVPFIAPSALTSSTCRRVAASCVHDGPVTSTPALLTHNARPPGRVAASLAIAAQARSSRTSSLEDQPLSGFAAAAAASASMSVRWTEYPRWCSASAIARPSPRPAPVTTATPYVIAAASQRGGEESTTGYRACALFPFGRQHHGGAGTSHPRRAVDAHDELFELVDRGQPSLEEEGLLTGHEVTGLDLLHLLQRHVRVVAAQDAGGLQLAHPFVHRGRR